MLKVSRFTEGFIRWGDMNERFLVSALRRVGRATAATGVLLCCSWCGVAIAQSDDEGSATEVQVRVLIEALLDIAAPLTLREPQADTVLQLLESGDDSMTQVQVVIDSLDTAAEFTLMISVDDAEVVSASSETIAIAADGDALRRSVQFELAAGKLGQTTVSLVVINSANGATVAERTMRVVVREPLQMHSPLDGTQIALVRGDGTSAASRVEVVIDQWYTENPVTLSVQLHDAESSPVFISTSSQVLMASADGSIRTRITVAAAEAGNTTLTLVASDRSGNRDSATVRVSAARIGELCETCLVPDMVIVSSGSFRMGSAAFSGESPERQVDINYDFAVGKYELTRGQFREFVDADGHDAGRNWDDTSFTQNDAHPVVSVSWNDAEEYLNWLSEETGEEWRLLSEAEWEYAARAGTVTPYHFGDDIDTTQARFNADGTEAVGRYPANAFDLHDMHGNVWELVEDCHHGDYDDAPTDGSAWVINCLRDNRRMRRGGSWFYFTNLNLRSAARAWSGVGVRANDVGFRVARTLSP